LSYGEVTMLLLYLRIG